MLISRWVILALGVLVALGSEGAAAPMTPQIAALQSQLEAEFARVGLTMSEGLGCATFGLGNALIESGEAPLAVQRMGAIARVEQGLDQSARFLYSVLMVLRQAITAGVVTATNARPMLEKARLWRPNAGAVALEPFLTVIAAEIVMELSYNAGQMATRAYLRELDQMANEAELRAYVGLVKTLAGQVAAGHVVLCGGMNLDEAAVRLHINMRTAPGQPYWGILCAPGQVANERSSTGFNGFWKHPEGMVVRIDGSNGYWDKAGRLAEYGFSDGHHGFKNLVEVTNPPPRAGQRVFRGLVLYRDTHGRDIAWREKSFVLVDDSTVFDNGVYWKRLSDAAGDH